MTVGVTLVFLASFVPGIAQATTTVDQVQDLLQQVKKLQDQLAELSKKQSDVFGELKDTVAIVRELRLGMTSDEVKALQEILAADPDVYPEGLITGFYGPLTEKAVKKFQLKHGLEQVGEVGPKTRARLNALLDDDTFVCKAWGKLIAPGQMKKLGQRDVDVSRCGKVPGGIWDKMTDGWWRNGTSTDADTTAPDIEGIDTDDISTSTATIIWETDEKTKGVVWYDTDNTIDTDDAEKASVSTFKTMHEIVLEDLNDGTDYYFIVVATDKAGNTATSSVEHFETEEE